MTGKKQQIEQEQLRAARPIMIRTLSILAAVAALAVSAAPVATAGTSKKPPSARFLDQPQPVTSFKPKAGPSKAKAPRPGVRNFTLDVASSEVVANHTEGTVRGISAGRYGDGRFAGVKDGTSNTLMVGE